MPGSISLRRNLIAFGPGRPVPSFLDVSEAYYCILSIEDHPLLWPNGSSEAGQGSLMMAGLTGDPVSFLRVHCCK